MSASGTEKFDYAGEMLVGAAGSSPWLYYIGARWMNPELGRWLSLDPELGKLSAPQTQNRYVYCVNNPLRFTDPTGEGWFKSLSKWWDKHKTEILGAVVIVAIAAATVLLPSVGGFIATVVLTAAESGLRSWAHGGSLQEIAQSMAAGAAIGALSYAGGAALGKVVTKVGGALLNTEIGAALKGVGSKIGSSISSKAPALWSKLMTPTFVRQSEGVGVRDLWEATGSGGFYKRGVEIFFPQVVEVGPTELGLSAGHLFLSEPARELSMGLWERYGGHPDYQS